MLVRLGILMVVVGACGDNSLPDTHCDAWRQWGNDGAHAGASCASGQALRTQLADVVYDPFAPQERADTYNSLTVHYQTPLLDGDEVYMLEKRGTYTPCAIGTNGPDCGRPEEAHRLDSQIWAEVAYAIDAAGALTARWAFESDWKPVPGRGENIFQPALTDAALLVPGAGGSLWMIDRATGATLRHVTPFGGDPEVYVSGGVTVSDGGRIYYNAVSVAAERPKSWLVRVFPDGGADTHDYADMVPDAPRQCYGFYQPDVTPMPWPPPPNADGTPVLPPLLECGPQRVGLNSTPTIGPDGTIFVVTHAFASTEYSYLIALDPELGLRWARSLRDILHDGCGATQECREGAPPGVNRDTGMLPAGTVDDATTASPVALPDGAVLYGAFTYYNGFRGHLLKLSAEGEPAGSYDFGWDLTPAVIGSGSDYKIIIKDNHYLDLAQRPDAWWFYMTALDANLNVLWKFTNTETRSCVPQTNGSIECVEDHPHGFEWCINAPAVDAAGTLYANSEDGNLYAITADGYLRDKLFLDSALGAAYTPLALDHTGRVFALNNGHLFVAGQ